jgi:hypothetical protein
MTSKFLKIVAVLACGTTVFSSASAQIVAANGDAQVRVGGSAPRVCRIGPPSTLSANNATFSASSANSGQVTISQLANPVSGIAQSSQISLSFSAVCNVAHAMIIRSTNGGLSRDDGSVAGAFSSVVGYRVDARWAGATTSRTFSGLPGQLSLAVEDGAAGTLEVDLQTQAGTTPLATGRYSDALVVEFSATS